MRDARGGGHPLVESITVGHDLWGASATASALAGLGASFPELKTVSIQILTDLEEPALAAAAHWSPAPLLAELRIAALGTAYGPSYATSAQLCAFVSGVCSSFSSLEVLELDLGIAFPGRPQPELGPGLGGVAASLPRLRSLVLRNVGITAADGCCGGGGGGGGGASLAAAAAAPSAVGLLPPSLTSLEFTNCGGFAAGARSVIEPSCNPSTSHSFLI